jgi:hypothetical protein
LAVRGTGHVASVGDEKYIKHFSQKTWSYLPLGKPKCTEPGTKLCI